MREFLSPPLSVASGLAERAAPTSVLAFVLPSCVGTPARSLSLFLSLILRSCRTSVSLSFSLLAVDVVRLSVCVLPRKNSDCCCRYLRRRRQFPGHNNATAAAGGRGGRTATRALRLRRTAGSLCWRLQRSGAPYLAVADLLLVK